MRKKKSGEEKQNMQCKEWIWSKPIAHRGLHDERYPENSLPAFDAAACAGISIELDVQLSKDGQAVVMHDDNLARMTGANLDIEKSTVAQIKAQRLRKTEYTVPTFEEVLKLINGRVPILVEVKKHRKRLEQTVYDQLKAYPGEYAIQSFNPMVIRWFRKTDPSIVCGLLSSRFDDQKMLRIERAGIMNARLFFMAKKPDFLSFEINSFPNRRIEGFREKLGIPVLGWTIRTLGDLDAAVQFCDNIIFENFSALQTYIQAYIKEFGEVPAFQEYSERIGDIPATI